MTNNAERTFTDEIADTVFLKVKDLIENPNTLLSEKKAMEMLDIKDARTLANWRKAGLRGHLVMGRRWYYFLSDIEAFVRNGGGSY